MPGETAELSPNALVVLHHRYLRRNEQRQVVETPAQMFERVARAVAGADTLFARSADVEAIAERFYRVMANLEFLPNSPTLMNAGAPLGQLMACFVLPIEDSLASIFDTLKQAALIQQSGGGTGFSFSKLRPRGDIVRSTGGVASGPISFISIYNQMTEVIKQGSARRGANMGILRVDHPDIMDFINAKRKPGELRNFNLSVGVTDAFMTAVARRTRYSLINPRTGQETRKLSARQVFDAIAEAAWESGEPGMVFLDRVNRDNPTPQLGAIEATNPCSEQPLLPYEACCLGSIDLAKLVVAEQGKPRVDYARLGELVDVAIHFLDNVVEINNYPLPETARLCRSNRKVGLGVMGFADMLIKLGIPYNSGQALEKAQEVMGFIQGRARQASAALAQVRGAFPNFVGSRYDRPGEPRLRNATLTTIAPTGTLSIIANTSSGIEPLFALSYTRRALDGEILGGEVHPLFVRVAREHGFYSEELMEKIKGHGTLAGLDEVPEWVRRLFVTALEISPEYHVKVQAAFQRHVDNAVSKTVNLRPEASVDDVKKVFSLAYRLGCKGVTVYRYGSRPSQVLAVQTYCLPCVSEDTLASGLSDCE